MCMCIRYCSILRNVLLCAWDHAQHAIAYIAALSCTIHIYALTCSLVLSVQQLQSYLFITVALAFSLLPNAQMQHFHIQSVKADDLGDLGTLHPMPSTIMKHAVKEMAMRGRQAIEALVLVWWNTCIECMDQCSQNRQKIRHIDKH